LLTTLSKEAPIFIENLGHDLVSTLVKACEPPIEHTKLGSKTTIWRREWPHSYSVFWSC